MDRFGRLLAALRAVLLASAGAAAGHVAAGAGEAFTIIARMSVESGWTPVPGEPILDGASGRGGGGGATPVTDVY